MAEEKRVARAAHWLGALSLSLAGVFAGDNTDTFGHLAQGRQIVQLGHIPLLDTWSLLPEPARPWHNYEWLSDLLFYGLYAGFGYDGILALKCLVLALTGWLLVSLAQRWGGERAAALAGLAIVVGIPASRFRLTDRPHVFGMCLAVVYLLCFTGLYAATEASQKSTRRRLIALLFVLHILWINLHGSHLLGVAISGLFLLFSPAAARRSMLTVLGLEVLASCISPYGPYIVLDAIDHVLDRRYRNVISEWHPWTEEVDPWLQLGPVLNAVLLTLVAPRLVRQGHALRAALAVTALLAVSCFRSIRFVADFVLISSASLGVGYASLVEGVRTKRFHLGLAGALGVAALVVPWGASQLAPNRGFGHGMIDARLPRAAGALLARAKITPRVFSSIDRSWCLMWEAPNARFFIDGRIPFYGPNHVAIGLLAMSDMKLFDLVAKKDEINAVVLVYSWPDQSKLTDHLRVHPDWSVALVDDHTVLFVRDDLARASGYPRLRVLQPSLHANWVLELPRDKEAALRTELDALTALPSARGYRHWVIGLRALASLRRGRAQDGFRWPRTPADWELYQSAAKSLRVAANTLDVPAVWSLDALVEATLCNLEGADAALAQATREVGPDRMSMMVAQEIALRRGNKASVEPLLRAAVGRPEAQGDAWLHELAEGLRVAPSCAPTP